MERPSWEWSDSEILLLEQPREEIWQLEACECLGCPAAACESNTKGAVNPDASAKDASFLPS